MFRDDFFYRLCSDVITLPPLRQRLHECPEELNALLENMIQRMTGESARELVEFVRDVLVTSIGVHYEWPGNVRELEQAVRRILITRTYEPQRIHETDAVAEFCRRVRDGSIDAEELLSKFCMIVTFSMVTSAPTLTGAFATAGGALYHRRDSPGSGDTQRIAAVW